MRVATAILATAIVVVACSSPEVTTPTFDQESSARQRAEDYGLSAERALAGTRFEGLGAGGITELVADTCARLDGSTDPDATLAEAAATIEAPAGDPVDDQILLTVLESGVVEVCPGAVLAAGAAGSDPAVVNPIGTYLDALAAVVAPDAVEGGVDEQLLVDAGEAACAEMDESGSPERALLAELQLLFGVEVGSLEEAAATLDEDEAVLAGAILAAATSVFCPEHREAVASFVSDLGGAV